MRRNVGRISGLAASLLPLAAGVVVATSGCGEPVIRRAEAAPTAGSVLEASSLYLLDLDDRPVDLERLGAGRIHVAVFTRSDCPVSNRFAPEVRSLYEGFHAKGVDFFLIYVDPSEKPDAIREHLRQYEYPCQALRDPKHTLVAQTGASVTPEAVVFDNNWKITYRGRINNMVEEVGNSRADATKHDLRDAIEATVAGRPVAEPVTMAKGCYIIDLN